MRPDRFQNLLVHHLTAVPGILKAQSFTDAGHDRSRYGLVIDHHTGSRTWWQITATSRNGDDYAQPESQPVTGERQAELPVPDLTGGSVPTADVEAAIAAVLLQADTAGEIAWLQRYSTRPQPGAISHGLSVEFHDTSKIYVNGLASTKQGREPRTHDLFKIDATV
jgi:hypothetical protein